MYVADQQMTETYRRAIVAMGFPQAHADLVQVDVARRQGRSSANLPDYRVTTGHLTTRRGEEIRRVLMLWYVNDRSGVLQETGDRDAISTMLVETVSHLPGPFRSSLPALPQWAVSAQAATMARLRRCA